MTLISKTVIALFLVVQSFIGLAFAEERPNIIVIYTDDNGYADLGVKGQVSDVKTPNIDDLARGGGRMSDGYATATRCVFSRLGLRAGQYQNRFGLESNPQIKEQETIAAFDNVSTLAERLSKAGYATGMSGKWHFGNIREIGDHGFDRVFHKNSNADGFWNMTLSGEDIPAQSQEGGYHVDVGADFAAAFIKRFADEPFFFYWAPRAPHVPLDAPKRYLKRFPGEMPERRHKALAMMAAVDDGVGRIVEQLRVAGIEGRTLIFLIGDNGAPYKMVKLDAPGGGPGWNGSLNDAMNGEKGTLSEGGIRTPVLAYWKGVIPAGQVYEEPVIALDVAATAVALAGAPEDSSLDGAYLIPYLTGKKSGAPHEALYWRWLSQSAIRKGDWKLLRLENRNYLFDLSADKEEKYNLAKDCPDLVRALERDLREWSDTLSPPGLDAVDDAGMRKQGRKFYEFFFDSRKRGVDDRGDRCAAAEGQERS